MALQCLESYGIQPTNDRQLPVYMSCKFEMYIFKIALVICENVRIAFLYVLSLFIYFFRLMVFKDCSI